MIANAVIDHIAANNHIYIPPNMVKGLLPMFHLDNIDWDEDSPDGKNSTHMLMICIMQRRSCDPRPIILNLDRKTKSLTIKQNNFELSPCHKPSQKSFSRTPGCSSFTLSDVDGDRRGNWRPWLIGRSLERVFLRKNVIAWCPSYQAQHPSCPEEEQLPHNSSADIQNSVEDQDIPSLLKLSSKAIDELARPSFGATKS